MKQQDGMFKVSDFSHNQLSHNYFRAYLRKMPNIDERVEKALIINSVNAGCIYRVKFFINGLRTSVIVDDFIPVTAENKPAFAQSDKQIFWALLIEKAWAKINGSYSRTRSSSQSFFGIHLTGAPAENINLSAVRSLKGGSWQTDLSMLEKCWHRIVAAFERNYTLMSEAKSAKQLKQLNGIEPERDYEIVEVQTLTTERGQLRLL